MYKKASFQSLGLADMSWYYLDRNNLISAPFCSSSSSLPASASVWWRSWSRGRGWGRGGWRRSQGRSRPRIPSSQSTCRGSPLWTPQASRSTLMKNMWKIIHSYYGEFGESIVPKYISYLCTRLLNHHGTGIYLHVLFYLFLYIKSDCSININFVYSK